MSGNLEPHDVTVKSVERGTSQEYEAYDEAAFRYFLEIERKRAERAGRSLLLLLVELDAGSQGRSAIPSSLASKVFAALTGCVREIDFIGWYGAGNLIGAVLMQGPEPPAPNVCTQIGERVAGLLRERLAAGVGRRLSVRVLQCVPEVRS